MSPVVPRRRGSFPRPVLDPSGTCWPSIADASRGLGVPYATVRVRAKKQLFGWAFVEPAPRPQSPRRPVPKQLESSVA